MKTPGQSLPPYPLLHLGFGNVVPKHRVVAIVSPLSSPMKRLKDQARTGGKLIDATEGRRTRSIVITDTDHVILSAIQVETVAARFESVAPPAGVPDPPEEPGGPDADDGP